MVRFDLENIRSLMDRPNNIRNVCVVAHVDHGKSSLVDSLLASNGIIPASDAGKRRGTDSRPDEQLRGITIKSTSVSLLWNAEQTKKSETPTGIYSEVPLEYLQADGSDFLINLIDTPGHVDFSSEVTAALRLCDGCIVLVDFVDGVCVQTQNVLRQALSQGIRPILCINKVDRAILELQLGAEEVYQRLVKVIDEVNAFIQALGVVEHQQSEFILSPELGNVLFTVGKQGWGFSIPQMARKYQSLWKQDWKKLSKKLWGDHYFDPETKKWCTSANSGTSLVSRAFCKFVWEPIERVVAACNTKNESELDRLLTKLGVSLTFQERQDLNERDLLRTVMYRWLPASEALLEAIVIHLPSPRSAQRYRVERLYTGPMDDETAQAIRACDPNGPLMMYVSKMIPATKDSKRFYAFGRIFSGTLTTSQKVRVLGARFEMNKKVDLFENVAIQRLALPMITRMEVVDSVPCGNMVCVMGVDDYIMKTGTIAALPTSHSIAGMQYSVAPVVRVSVSPQKAADLPKLTNALRLLNQTDPVLEVTVDGNGQHIIGCAGELHLEICLYDLRNILGGVEIDVADPIVSFMETVTMESSVNCLTKSPNGHNRFYGRSEPLSSELVAALSEKKLQKLENKERSSRLSTEFGWDLTEARKIWAFGSETLETNILVDGTKGVQYMNEVKDSVVAGFNWVSRSGFLAEEPLQGVKFTINDAVLHADTIHRGAGQVIPATRRLFAASQLSAAPRLLEPVFRVEIQCDETALGGVYSVLRQRRGVVNDTQIKGANIYNIQGYLPVMESFGFTAQLRASTSGQAFEQCTFDHWQLVESDPYQTGSVANEIVCSIRKRKGLKAAIPVVEDYLDRL